MIFCKYSAKMSIFVNYKQINRMRVKSLSAVLLAACLTLPSAALRADETSREMRRALDLYENGMYERARTIFDSFGDDPLAEGYSVLCAIRTGSDDYPVLLEDYLTRHQGSSLAPTIHYRYALRLFEEGSYEAAAEEFALVDYSDIPTGDRASATFKKGYCAWEEGDFAAARGFFTSVVKMPYSDCTAPSRFYLGLMDYEAGEFERALGNFEVSVTDARFEEVSRYYITDCRFNLKDYDYVLDEGVALFENSSYGRRERLARMISEAYLVRGDNENARKYYDSLSRSDMSRSDYFYAGSLLYSVGEYQGAIDNFLAMGERADSLGQIASYHLAGSYLNVRNNVAAMDAFKDAAAVDYDPVITEDAYFNYAKLAFDLNKDTSGFAGYIDRYSTTTKGDQIYSYMALAALYDKDYESAVAAYDNIDELSPDMLSNYTKANFLRASQLIDSGSWSDAIPCLRAAAYYLPTDDRLSQLDRYWLAEAYYRTEKYGQSASIWTELYNASALNGRSEGALLPYNVAYSNYREARYTEAARWFDIYNATGSILYREDALTRRADCDFVQRRYKDAIDSYQKVLDEFQSPNSVYPYYRQSLCYGLTGNKKKKAEVLSAVMNASPAAEMYPEAMYELGSTYMDLRDNDSALNTFHHLRAHTSDSTWAARSLVGLGMASRNKGDYDKSLEYYKKVVSMMPGSEYADESLSAIESIYQTRGEPEKYLEYVEQNRLDASKSDADRARMYFNTAEQVFLAGNYSQALNLLNRYVSEYPAGENIEEATYYLAETHKSLGGREKACEYYAAVMNMGGTGAFAEGARLGFAEQSYKLERWSDAYQGYAALLSTAKLEANQVTARTGMMRSAYRGKDWQNAIAATYAVKTDEHSDDALRLEADYIKAKSYMATSRRVEALDMFEDIASAHPGTPEGAEARVITIQDCYDKGDFEAVEQAVYDFSANAGDQSYWLAKAYVLLGDSFYARDLKQQAKATWESILEGYEPFGATDDVPDNVRAKLSQFEQ